MNTNIRIKKNKNKKQYKRKREINHASLIRISSGTCPSIKWK